MTERAPLDDYGELTAPATLTIRGLLPGPIERVWAYPTESDLRRTWLAAGAMALQVGAPFELVWRNGDVTFKLEPQGTEVLLTVIHRRLPDRPTLLGVSAGWHMHLDILVARATGTAPGPFWDGWSRRRQAYDRRLPA
jgi:uncharacterized protein YndB with AHSA1/START domain